MKKDIRKMKSSDKDKKSKTSPLQVKIGYIQDLKKKQDYE